MEFDDLQPLRRAGEAEGEADREGVSPQYPPGAGISPNAVTHLVADLLETTGLLPLDRLAQARSRAGSGSLAEAIMDERVASAAPADLEVPGLRTESG
ncbi:MAG: hypothetical protein ACRDM7_06370, partial [Thermoleophilaceae bacterium]